MKNTQNAFDAINTIAPIFSNIMNEVLNHQTESKTENTFKVASANIAEIENGYEIQVAFPGFAKEEIVLNIEEDVLHITATKKEAATQENVKFLKKEIDSRNFKRSFNLSNKIDKSKISASHKDGILYVTLLKKDNISFNIKVN
jgi:HSP20 family protein